MPVSSDDFKQALQFWASGVAVVTTKSEKFGIQGMTVTSFTSVSLEPPQILVCINQSADTGEGIKESKQFSVNVLNSGQEGVSNQFAGGSSQQQRFKDSKWMPGTLDTPNLTESLMTLDCSVVNLIESGTHLIIVGEVQNTTCRSGEPLLYYRGAYRTIDFD